MKAAIISLLVFCGLGGGFFLGFVGLFLLPLSIFIIGYLLIKNKNSFYTQMSEYKGFSSLKEYDFINSPSKKISFQFDKSVSMVEGDEAQVINELRAQG